MTVVDEGRIIGIETTHFFQDLQGKFYLYFGRPTCPECVEFEPHLQKYLEESGWVVYYYNTAYWKDDPQYSTVLERYHVESVPLLVETVNGAFRDMYQFDADASAEEIQSQLQGFFDPKISIFPVASQNNFPIQFDSYLFALTFLIMGFNLCYLLLRRKKYLHSGEPVWGVLVNATLIFALHLAIAGFGFGFAMHYEATPATDFVAKLGTWTWLTVPFIVSICRGK